MLKGITLLGVALLVAAPAIAETGVVSKLHAGYYNTCVQINGHLYVPKATQRGGDPQQQKAEQRAWMILEGSYDHNRIVGFDVLGTWQDCRNGPALEITNINDPPDPSNQ